MAALGEDLLGIVNKLQDLVFNTIGNDSLDLPQIVRTLSYFAVPLLTIALQGCRRFPILWQIFRPRKHRRPRFPTPWQRNRYSKTAHSPAHQRPYRRRH